MPLRLARFNRSGATNLIHLTVWLKNGIGNGQYSGMQEQSGKMGRVLGHAAYTQRLVAIEGVLIQMALAVELRAQVSAQSLRDSFWQNRVNHHCPALL